MLKQRLKLGRYFGIPLYVHWSLALIVAWFGYQTLRFGGGWVDLLFMVGLLATMYLCVTLHEYGHSLMARRFGVNTVDITLLPIGGIARLERMPRIPWQELLVAVAGPAVNVVIAMLLATGLLFSGILSQVAGPGGLETLLASTSGTNLLSFVWAVFALNVGLVLFNLVPAFPMDGGRVFRSLLAMVFEYRRATWIAARVGLGCAVVMAGLALYSQHVVVLLISFFIAWAGVMEARQVDVTESVRGLRVADALVSGTPTLAASMTVRQAADVWCQRPESALPVTDGADRLFGMVRLRDIADTLRSGQDGLPVGELVHRDAPIAWPNQLLEELLTTLPRKAGRQLPVLGNDMQLLGLLDLDAITDRAVLRGAVSGDETKPHSPLPTASSDPQWTPQQPGTVAGANPYSASPHHAPTPPRDRLGDGPSYLA